MIQARINTDNQLMDFSYSIWKDFPNRVRSTGAYIISYQGGPIEHGTHVTGSFAWPGAEREYNVACTVGMALAYFRM